MYNIGICDDGKGICASLEEMVQQYAKEKKISVETNVFFHEFDNLGMDRSYIGQKVSYKIVRNENKERAINVRLLES